MDRISTATKAVDLFGAGKHGFKDGNLGLGIVPTDMNAAWFNGVQEELLSIIETAGLAPAAGTLTLVRQAIDIMIRKCAGAIAVAAGTVDAITGDFTPDVLAYTDGLRVGVRATGANTSATPTFKPDALGAKTIVKGNNVPLAAGDIAGAGHWLALQYDLALDRWVLLNPARSVISVGRQVFTASGTFTVPPGVTTVYLTGVGGGGAGGGVVVNARTAGAGGASGGGLLRSAVAVVPGASVTVTIGAGGTPVSASTGNAGGSTTFGALATMAGGPGGPAGTIDLGGQSFVAAVAGGGAGGGSLVADIGGVAGRVARGGDGGGSLVSPPVPGPCSIGGGVNGVSGNSGQGFGQGGSGAISTNPAGGALGGGAGTNGILIVEW